MDLLHIALREKAALFADVFDSKQRDDSLTMPQSCFSEAELTTFAFRSGEVNKLLLELDPYGDAGHDGIFPLFFISPLAAGAYFTHLPVGRGFSAIP